MRCACAGCVDAVVVGCCAAFAITGTLEPVRFLSGLQVFDLSNNQITGMHISHDCHAGGGCRSEWEGVQLCEYASWKRSITADLLLCFLRVD